MKRALLVPFSFFSLALFGQTWCPPGANWIFPHWSTVADVDGLAEYTYHKDTVILGIGCKYIKANFAGKLSYNYSIYPPTQSFDPVYSKHYTYEDNHTLYVYNHFGGFDTIVNFHSSPGDAWFGPRSPYCPYRLHFKVTDTSTIFINGKLLKKIDVVAKYISENSNDTSNISFTFVESLYQLQGTSSSFGFIPFYCDGPDPAAELASITHICYQDNEIGVYNPKGLPCYKGVGIQESNLRTPLFAGPNPFDDFVRVSAQKQSKVRLMTSSGFLEREFDTDTGGNYDLATHQLSAGFYLLQFIQDGRIVHVVKLVKGGR